MSESMANARPATACGEAPRPPEGAHVATREQLAHWTRSLDCIHCGLCLSSCPTYQVTGRENASPRGRIYLMRAVAEGRLEPDASYTQALDECLVCRNCETACPSGVRFGELMEFARDEEKKRVPPRGLAGFVERIAFRHVLPKRRVLGALLGTLRLYQRSGVQTLVRKSGLLRRLAPQLAAREALLPVIPSRRERAPLLERYPAHGERRATVGFLTGCVMHPLMPEVHRATIRVLNDQGFDVVVPPSQGCCGALHFHFGHADEGKELARANLRAFLREPLDAIVNNSAGCGAAMKEYPHQLEGEEARRFSSLVRDVSEFLVERGLRPIAPGPKLRVAYDEPCHLIHAQKISAAPKQLLRAIPGVELIPFDGQESCCGAAGIYNLVQPTLADAILSPKIAAIAKVRPDVVVTGNPGCLMQIKNGLAAAGLAIPVKHPIELVP
ncbi:MAG: 4Fe-4S dicluster domain-containing protein [Planctomycetes bacterium]|nr:4Fe-4S dicluster domain-containing protein [Planctomycetota bacterium]